MAPKRGPQEQSTLCWECNNTNKYDCPWFNPDDPQPVPGWVAELIPKHRIAESYLVKECPKFEPMSQRTVVAPPPQAGIQGVSRRKTKAGIRWMATIRLHRKSYYLGTFKTEAEAIEARLAAEAAVARGEDPRRGRPRSEDAMGEAYPPGHQPGVRRRDCYWEAYIQRKGKKYHLGYFKTKVEAIEARLAAEEALARGEDPKKEKLEPKTYPPGCHPGVRRRDCYWIARITHKGKHYHLGCFKTEEKAIAARKAAEEAIKRGEIPAH